MQNAKALAVTYINAWNAHNAGERRSLVKKVWAPGGSYYDPMMHADGVDNICEMIGAAQRNFPGHVFTLKDQVDAHHEFIRFTWDIGVPGKPVTASGTDVCHVSADGRFKEVVGFIDTMPGR
jgi:hypothetical protein